MTHNRLTTYNYNTGSYEINWKHAEQLLPPTPDDAELYYGPFSATSSHKLAKTWWGQEWLNRCESRSRENDIHNARKNARYGMTLLVRVSAGEVAGIFSESRNYIYQAHVVRFELRTFTTEEWRQVDAVVTGCTRYLAGLMAGQFDYELLERLLDLSVDPFTLPRFPGHYTRGYGNKVYSLALTYILAALIDNDPLILFQMRGRSTAALLTNWLNEAPPTDDEDDLSIADPSAYWISQPLPDLGTPPELSSPLNLDLLPAKMLGRIPQVCAEATPHAAELWEHMTPIITQDAHPVFQLTESEPDPLPEDMRNRYDEIIILTDSYCEQALSEEFSELARKLTHTLAAHHEPLIDRGHAKTWACAILYALAETNDLFRDNVTGHRIKPQELCDAFKMSQNTTSSRSQKIREHLNISFHDPRWIHNTHAMNNPTQHLVRHRGLLVDRRHLVTSDNSV